MTIMEILSSPAFWIAFVVGSVVTKLILNAIEE